VRALSEHPPSSVSVVPAARDQEPILANLLELYIYDFSEYLPVELGPDGRFGYKNLCEYWSEPDHHPFLITVDEKLAGFALVKKARTFSSDDQAGSDTVWDMAEFFIVRANRRRGVGLIAAHQIWCQFPGRWQVRVMRANLAALNFWQRAVDTFAGHALVPISIERDEKPWDVFTFESKA
jgi:predicted acetyltransferase